MKLAALARKAGLDPSVASIFEQPTLLDLPLHTQELTEDPAITEQAPCSLLGVKNSTDFIRDVISPSLPMDADIMDVLPTTEFQRLYLRRHRCAYSLLNLPRALDEERLRTACQIVTKKHRILRTTKMVLSRSFFSTLTSIWRDIRIRTRSGPFLVRRVDLSKGRSCTSSIWCSFLPT